MSARNPSNKSAANLSSIFYRDLLKAKASDLPRALFDASVSVQAIIQLPHMAGEDIGDELQNLIDDEDVLEVLLGDKIIDPADLVNYNGFVVKANAQIWNFATTTFGKDGRMKSGCHNDMGSFVVYGFAESLTDAYKAMINQVVARQAKQIAKGLEVPS